METLVDLFPVICSHLFVDHDQFVQVADTAVLFVACLVDAMALLALLLALGTLISQVTLQILPRDFDQLASVTRHELHWTDLYMTF